MQIRTLGEDNDRTMTSDDQGSRGTAVTSTDQIGKVFVVVGQDVRRCFVCEEVFTRKGASCHFNMVCVAERKDSGE